LSVRAKNKNYKKSNEIVVRYMPAVRAMSFRLKERLPSSVDVNDLISIGMEELIKLSRRYDTELNNSFWGYAKKRVYGSMLDFLRSLDVISRSNRRLVKAIDLEVSKCAVEDLYEPSDEYLAEKLGEPIEKIREAKLASQINTNVPLNEHIMGYKDEDIEKIIEREQMIEAIKDILSTLSDREQMIITLYYYDELNLKEISELFDISESRVSQIHKELVNKLRLKLIE
jgi:RNA polymerase sigma factor for flagellar operon FliA